VGARACACEGVRQCIARSGAMLFHESCGRSITAAPRGQRPVNAERPHGPVEHLRTWLRPRSRNAPRVADGRRDPRGATVSRTGGATPGAREGREGRG
jgi:hypothetical protein